MISLRESNMSSNRKIDSVDGAIYLIRGQRVMLDSDLAAIYGTSTMRLNEQFKRNHKRFPDDFAFVLTREEFASLISQIAISKKSRGGRRKPPIVFTEHGAIMLASVLNSDVAVQASVRVPLGVRSGASVPIQVLVGGVTSQPGVVVAIQ